MALLTLVLLFLLLLYWGGARLDYGMWFLPRLFQGKAIFAYVMVPLVTIGIYDFIKKPSIKNLVLLFAYEIAGPGFTSSGLLLLPLTTGIMILTGFISINRNLKVHILALSSLVPALISLVLLWLDSGGSGKLVSRNMYPYLFFGTHHGLRGEIIIAILYLFPFLFLFRQKRSFLPVYFLLSLFFISPWSADILKLISSNLNWRYLWVIPIPLLVALAWGFSWNSFRGKLQKGALLAITVAVIYLFEPINTFDSAVPEEHLSRGYDIERNLYEPALQILELLPEHSLLLADKKMAPIITRFNRHPRLVFLKTNYTLSYMNFNPEETPKWEWRQKLEEDLKVIQEKTSQEFLTLLRENHVNAVTLLSKKISPAQVKALQADGFKKIDLKDSYLLFLKEPTAPLPLPLRTEN